MTLLAGFTESTGGQAPAPWVLPHDPTYGLKVWYDDVTEQLVVGADAAGEGVGACALDSTGAACDTDLWFAPEVELIVTGAGKRPRRVRRPVLCGKSGGCAAGTGAYAGWISHRGVVDLSQSVLVAAGIIPAGADPLDHISTVLVSYCEASASVCANDQSLQLVQVFESPGLPDLIVESIRWSEDDGQTWHQGDIAAGNDVWFEADVRNQGSGATPPGVIIGVAFAINSGSGYSLVSFADTYTASLPAGQMISLRANGGPGGGDKYWNNVPSGVHVVRGWVDDVNRMAELNESNNQLEVAVSVEGVEPPPVEPPPDGFTSYDAIPFFSDIVVPASQATPGWFPCQLFWDLGSHFTNATKMQNARNANQVITNDGRIPRAECGMRQRTWIKSRAKSSFSNPTQAAANGADEEFYNHPTLSAEFRAWGQWVFDRPQYLAKRESGGTPDTSWNSWGGHWGHVSPCVELDPADVLAGAPGNTWGDWFALKWGQMAAQCGAWGISPHDFMTDIPHNTAATLDFNTRVVDRFETVKSVTVPGASISARASYIKASLPNEWCDFWAESYADMYDATLARIEVETGHFGILQHSDSRWPSRQRLQGQDLRIWFSRMPGERVIHRSDYRTMQSDRGGEPPSHMIAAIGMRTSRDPGIRLGPNLHVWDGSAGPQFQSGLDKFYPVGTPPINTANDQFVFGDEWLKRLWFGACWAHVPVVADGTVRRAIAWVQRSYQDTGTIYGTWMNAIRNVIPRRAFGLAVYYSVAIERAREFWWMSTGQTQQNNLYMSAPTVYPYTDTHRIPYNYWVSDAHLATLGATGHPAGWILINRYHPVTSADLLPTSERTALEAIAPILDTVAAAQSFDKPLQFSSNVVGYGFGDQNNRLIVVPTNLNSSTNAATVTIKTLANGNYRATDLLSGATIDFSSSGGVASLPVTLTRWQTRALSITTLAGGPVF